MLLVLLVIIPYINPIHLPNFQPGHDSSMSTALFSTPSFMPCFNSAKVMMPSPFSSSSLNCFFSLGCLDRNRAIRPKRKINPENTGKCLETTSKKKVSQAMNDWKSQSMNSVGFPGERIARNARYRGGWHVDQSQVKMIPVSINIGVEEKQLTIIHPSIWIIRTRSWVN